MHHVGAATGSPRRTGATNSSSNSKSAASDGVTISRGRGRPPKSAGKLQHGQHDTNIKVAKDASSEKSVPVAKESSKSERRRLVVEKGKDVSAANQDNGDDHSSSAKKLKVTTADELTGGASKSEKSSPSSSSDVLHMETFESDASPHAGDFWSLHCALCCANNAGSSHDVPLSEALFLCPSCDRKYPTQRALGRV